MKKNMIAIMMSFVIAAGSIVSIPVLGAEIGITSVEAAAETDAEDIERAGTLEDDILETDMTQEDYALESAPSSEMEMDEDDSDEQSDLEEDSVDSVQDVSKESYGEEADDDEFLGLLEQPVNGESESLDSEEEQDVYTEEIDMPEEVTRESQNSGEEGFRREGMCGDNVKWVLTGTKPDTDPDLTLTISGQGDMWPVDTFNWTLYNDVIKKVVIEEGVTGIGEDAFSNFEILETVTIPDTVTKIGHSAFAECVKLDHVRLPDGVTIIGDGAFSGCSSLTDIRIPESVTYFGDIAFYECSSLVNIEIPKNVTKVGAYTFKDCHSLENIIIPEGVKVIEYQAFYGCTSLKSISLPSTLTSIECAAFHECCSLESITIPDGVKIIDDYTFYSCSSLTDVVIPDEVTYIGIEAFNECRELTSLKSNGKNASYAKNVQVSVIIPNGVTKIENNAFNGCGNLTSAAIPASVTYIGNYAFPANTTTSYVKGNKAAGESISGKGFTIYGYTGSYAEHYAHEKGFPFVVIDGISWEDQGTYSPYKTVAIQSVSTGCFITCDVNAKNDEGRYPRMDNPNLNVDGTRIGSYEKFELVPCSDGSYALRSVVNRQFISYNIRTNIVTPGVVYEWLSCDADFIGDDQKLTLTKGSSGVVKFKNMDKWFCVENGKLHYTDHKDKAEVFDMILLDDNQYTDEEISRLSDDEWFDLYDMGIGGYYNIQCEVGHNTEHNADTLAGGGREGYKGLGFTLMNTEDQIGKRDYIEIDQMQCFVAYKKIGEKYDVIIAFQGTAGYSISDQWSDMWSNLTGGGKADGAGMHEGYHLMADKLIKMEGSIKDSKDDNKAISLEELICMAKKENGEKANFTILGHSMGGAIAQCYAVHLAEQGVSKEKIKGRTFNSALAVNKDVKGFEDWYNLCVSSDSVCNGLVTGSILSYGVHRIGKTIWLYDNEPDINDPAPLVNISSGKHVMDEYACLYQILSSFRKTDKCSHDWDEGKTTVVSTKDKDGIRTFTCAKCGKTKVEEIPAFGSFKVSGLVSKYYTGKPITQAPVLSNGGLTLKENKDYVVSYMNNVNVGAAKIIFKGIGDYSGSFATQFIILPGKTIRADMYNLANNVKVEWKEVPGAKYYKVYRSGVEDPVIVTSKLAGWDKEHGLENGKKYTYKIVASLTGKEDSSGDSSLSYSKDMYRLKTVVIRSAKNTAPGKVTVKYDKTATGDSYVLQYCDRQDMVGAKTKVVLGVNNTSYVIGGLKKGKTYYISIRVRKKVNGIDYYTTFGVPKKVTIIK